LPIWPERRLEVVHEFQNRADYDYVTGVLETVQGIVFFNRITVLVATNRLPGCARGIYDGLKHVDGLKLSLATNTETAERFLMQQAYDFMLVVGYLLYSWDYKIVRIAQSKNIKTVMVANLDPLISDICVRHNIPHKLDRYKEIGKLPWLLKTLDEGMGS
jgi:hypothetical protein